MSDRYATRRELSRVPPTPEGNEIISTFPSKLTPMLDAEPNAMNPLH